MSDLIQFFEALEDDEEGEGDVSSFDAPLDLPKRVVQELCKQWGIPEPHLNLQVYSNQDEYSYTRPGEQIDTTGKDGIYTQYKEAYVKTWWSPLPAPSPFYQQLLPRAWLRIQHILKTGYIDISLCWGNSQTRVLAQFKLGKTGKLGIRKILKGGI